MVTAFIWVDVTWHVIGWTRVCAKLCAMQYANGGQLFTPFWRNCVCEINPRESRVRHQHLFMIGLKWESKRTTMSSNNQKLSTTERFIKSEYVLNMVRPWNFLTDGCFRHFDYISTCWTNWNWTKVSKVSLVNSRRWILGGNHKWWRRLKASAVI